MLYFLENKMKLHGELNSQHNKTNNITPTNREKLEAQKTCDIIRTNFQGDFTDTCYLQ